VSNTHISIVSKDAPVRVSVNQTSTQAWVSIDTEGCRLSLHLQPEDIQQLALDIWNGIRPMLEPEKVTPLEQMNLPSVFITTGNAHG
jgi:hypothetical protein